MIKLCIMIKKCAYKAKFLSTFLLLSLKVLIRILHFLSAVLLCYMISFFYSTSMLALILLFLSSCSIVSDSLRPHGLQHTRFPCPSLSPRVWSNSCILSHSIDIFCNDYYLVLEVYVSNQIFI